MWKCVLVLSLGSGRIRDEWVWGLHRPSGKADVSSVTLFIATTVSRPQMCLCWRYRALQDYLDLKGQR